MKLVIFASVCTLLLSVVSAENVVVGNSTNDVELLEDIESNGIIDTIVKTFLNNIRSYLKKKEPYLLPDFPEQKVKDKNVNVHVKLTHVKENYGSQFVINNIDSQLLKLTMSFDATFPRIEFTGHYEIKGKVLGKRVHGKGKFKIAGKNIHTTGKAYVHLVHSYVQMKDLKIHYTVEKSIGTATGLKVKGLSQKKVHKLLNKSLQKYFTDNEIVVCKTMSHKIMGIVNKYLYGKTLKDFINWLKNFIPGKHLEYM